MVLANGEINIIADMEGTTGVKLHNNRQKLRARFDIRRKLGQGTYGKVQLAVNKETSEEVAIKTIKKSKIETEQDLVRIQREIQIMSSVQHPHIIHIYEVFENREKIVLVMEYASGGELYDYLSFKKVLTEPEARRIFRQVASAVFYCHKNMICHRDLKLENILLDERGNAKIADFGLSNIFNERNFLSTFCGSPLYASPEIVQGTPYYGPEVDCWSLGVLLYTLVYGAMPFDGSNFKKLVKQISEGDYYEPRVPSDASGLIRKMLTVDPAKRASVDDICCDLWVDVGEEIPLLDVAQDMCKLMPVRLDYLLALTASQPPLNPDGSCNDGDLKKGVDTNGLKDDMACETKENQIEGLGTEENDMDQWERPALQALDSTTGLSNKDAQVNGDFAKKHKLTSSSAVLGNSSTTNVLRKKMKNETTPSDDDNDKGGGAEKVAQSASDNVEAMEADAVESDRAASTADAIDNLANNSVPTTEIVLDKPEPSVLPSEPSKELPPEESEPEPTALNDNEQESQQSLDTVASEAVLENASDSRKVSDSAVKSKSSSVAKKATTTVTPPSAAGSTKVPKLKKSISISKDGATPSPTDATAVTPPSAGTEKRKVCFPPSRISDVRKSFERKSPEKKPLGVVGSKVSSFKNKFESPPTTPETLASPTKQVPKPLSGLGTPAGKAPLVKTESQDKKPEDGTQESAANAKKPAVLSRQSSRGNARTSPTKSLQRNDKGAAFDQNGQHHRGCVPHEARAAAVQEAKVSPPKTLPFKRRSPPAAVSATPDASSRKNSLTKTGSGIARAAPAKDTPLVRRPSGSSVSRSLSSSGPRPKSPTKVVKTRPGNASANELAPLPNAEQASIAQAPENQEAATAPKVDLDAAVPKTIEENMMAEVRNEKRGSIEIAPLPASALSRHYPEDNDEETAAAGIGAPLVRFIPRDQGQFHLIGVKSEVMFDVASGGQPEVPAVEEAKVENPVAKPEKEEDSKIIRYIATVRRHGSSDEQLDDGPERVTLLDLRCSTTCDDLAAGDGAAPSGKEVAKQKVASQVNREMKTKSKAQSTQAEDSSSTEQRGYSMYRSKYRSIQKFRSVVEKRGGDGEEVVEEEKSSTKASVDQGRAPSLERSDSFSSTGSNDDLEDVFESLTSESLFTSLLSRTRNLINRLTEGDAHTTRWFQSSLMGRSGVSIGGTLPSSVSSFMFNAPNISVRFNQPAGASVRNRFTEAPKSTYRISARSGCDLGRSNSAREYDSSEAKNYASDSGGSRTTPRWRSKTRQVKEDDDTAFMSDTGGSGYRSHQSSYSNFNSNRSSSSVTMSSSSLRSKEDASRRSRYDAFRSREPREEPPHDVLAALLRHRNRSLDAHRPRSFYEPEPHQPPQAGMDAASDSGRESLYGTVRRPTRFQRYTKSISKELSEEYESEESTLHRPRSMVALAEPKEAKAAASVSVSRDYSKNVSQTGNTKREEEEEYEHEQRVTEQEGGRVTTVRRETKRSISQTQDSGGAAGKTGDAEVQNATPVKKQGPDDFLARQDSGIGSMHESSTPATPTSAGAQSRKGYMRFARSVSNELESLEEEINRMGIGKRRQGGKSPTEEGEGRAATPASDSAETGSVCSDGTTASTDTLNSSSQYARAPEEESVGDRIRRKSFFPRFNESSRIPRKGRSALSASSSAASMRSELSRGPSFRQHHLYDEDPAFSTRYFDPSPDFYSGALNRNGSTASQRWSMHFGAGGGESEYPYGGNEPSTSSASTSRRRGSGGGNPDVMTYLRRNTEAAPPEEGLEHGMMSRTHSLPEENSPPLRPVFRQHSMPGGQSNGNGNGQPAGEGGERQGAPRRPSRLGLHARNYSPCEETGESLATSPSGAPSSGRSWRRSRFGSGNVDPLEGWESARGRPGASFASLMGALESPSEVLQKAMDLCDSLRFS